MRPLTATLAKTTVDLFEAVAVGKVDDAWRLAETIKGTAWKAAMPALASAVGALQDSLELGARSEEEMIVALHAIFSEVRRAVEEESE